MWRALFLALGGTLLVMGIESMVLDHAVLATDSGFIQSPQPRLEPVLDEWGIEIDRREVTPEPRVVSPPEWAPWSMLSTGIIMLFYGFARKTRRVAAAIMDDDDDD